MSNGGLGIGVVVIATWAAANPARRVVESNGGPPPWSLIVVAITLCMIAATSGPLLDVLEISPPNARIAAGLTLAILCLVQLIRPPRAASGTNPPEQGGRPAQATRQGWLVPLAFPILLRPELLLVALSGGRDHGLLPVVAATIAALAATYLLGRSGENGQLSPGLIRGLAALGSALGVLAAVDLILDGVLSI